MIRTSKRGRHPSGLQPLTEVRLQRCVRVYHGYYTASERKEALPRATTWINLKDALRSEISHSQKGTLIPLTQNTLQEPQL